MIRITHEACTSQSVDPGQRPSRPDTLIPSLVLESPSMCDAITAGHLNDAPRPAICPPHCVRGAPAMSCLHPAALPITAFRVFGSAISGSGQVARIINVAGFVRRITSRNHKCNALATACAVIA
jgi:hypothetical protein